VNQKPDRGRRSGFSLVEILIVVVILGILAAIAVPKLSNASQLARENSLKDSLRLLRTQLGVYKAQHDLFPGYPNGNSFQTPTFQAASDQLLLYSDAIGNTSATGSVIYKWGPYLNTMPPDPVNAMVTWKIIGPSEQFTPDGTTGWLYQPSSGMLKANVAGEDSSGHTIVDY